MDLIIHVGLHKTGTSTLQNFLYINRFNLLKYNIYYPDIAILHEGQQALIPACYSDLVHYQYLKKNTNSLNIFLGELKQNLDQKKPKLTIMSSEVWSEICFLEKDSLHLINNKIAPLFDSVKILVSIRNFEDLALSALKYTIRLRIKDPSDYNIISEYYYFLNSAKRVFNYWLESGLSIIVKNYENNQQDLVSNYLEDIFELYSPEARSILYNNKAEKINVDNLPTIVYLIYFLKNNTNNQTQNITQANQLIEKLLIKYKNSNLQNNNLLKYLKNFEDKYYNHEDLTNTSLEQKIKALNFAGIKI